MSVKLMFRSIPSFPGYLINLRGQVYSYKNNKFLKTTVQNGYLFVSLTLKGKTRKVALHRLIMMTFKPVSGMAKLQVHHKNGKRSDNRLANLEWVDPSTHAKLPKHKLSKGVYSWNIGHKRFRVVLKVQGKAKTVGYYYTYAEAQQAYYDAFYDVHGVYPDTKEYSAS